MKSNKFSILLFIFIFLFSISISLAQSSNSKILPVELSYFEVNLRNLAAEISFSTASEANNHGFNIEKRLYEPGKEKQDTFQFVTFIKGYGHSSTDHYYQFRDSNIVFDTLYEYRLSQIDKDGTISKFNNSTRVIYTKISSDVKNLFDIKIAELENITPNPTNSNCTISFRLSQSSNVKLEIIDLNADNICTIIDGKLDANNYNIKWDLTNYNKQKIAVGTYYCRLTVANQVTSKQIIVD